MPNAGEIWLDTCYYPDADGTWRSKYILILGFTKASDLVHRVLTSRGNGRSRNPACHHGDPYPAYFLGVIGGPLHKDSWLDLRSANDYDSLNFKKATSNGSIKFIETLPKPVFCAALACAMAADDTTAFQRQAMDRQRQALSCPAA
ncbi:hypothetical protein [Paraburkholderia bannensis]|uniref:hypothetical protein n=1 Tax=Paraburkholderia bannensis TaxID=765414 RepID=UPI002AB6AD1A|nr:hypothetical protein [Paraburkholderia bannensis]